MGYAHAYNSAESFFHTVQDARIISNYFALQAQRNSYNLCCPFHNHADIHFDTLSLLNFTRELNIYMPLYLHSYTDINSLL